MALAWPLALLQVSNIIDNPWSITGNRAEDAGIALADVLRQHVQGNRPVTLMGYCFGARVIYYCLLDLANSEVDMRGVIQDVYLIGAPIPAKEQDWKKAKSVVAGNLYNGYSRSDWLLKFVYRATSGETKVAGLQPIECDFVMNVDLTDLVDKSSMYTQRMPYILQRFDLLSEDTELEPLPKADETDEDGENDAKEDDPIGELLACYGEDSDKSKNNPKETNLQSEEKSEPSRDDVMTLLMEYSRRLSDDAGDDTHPVYHNKGQSKSAFKGDLTDDDIAMIIAGPSPKLNIEQVKKDMEATPETERATKTANKTLPPPAGKKKKKGKKKRPINLADQARMMQLEKEYKARPVVRLMKKLTDSSETEV